MTKQRGETEFDLSRAGWRKDICACRLQCAIRTD